MGILNPQGAGGDLSFLRCWLNLHPLGNEEQAEQEQREPALLVWSVEECWAAWDTLQCETTWS